MKFAVVFAVVVMGALAQAQTATVPTSAYMRSLQGRREAAA